jgi:hypothetical protein
VLSLEKGKGEEDLQEVVSMVFPKPGETPQFPAEATQAFAVDVPFGAWAWFAGDTLDENNLPLDEIQAFAEDARTVLDKRDIEGTLALVNTKNNEMARAFHLPVEERLADSRSFFEEMFATGGWAMPRPDYTRMQVRLHAQGKLAEVVDPEGAPILQTLSLEGGFSFCLPLWLSRANNAWVLCR